MRLDKYLFEKGKISSRSKAKQLIEEGHVEVDGKVVLKPSYELLCYETITIIDYPKYVSRGAYKLLRAIEIFDVDFGNRVVLDIGASTGGFTQVALEGGAKKVYAVDVGNGELSQKLREDSRVVNLENTDFRTIKKEQIGDCDLVVGDISFISLRHVLPKVKELFGQIEMVILFKPQFECGKEIAKKYKGVIKNSALHKGMLKDFVNYLNGLNFKICGLTYSSIQGKSGNIEYLFYLNGKKNIPFRVDEVVSSAFENFKSEKK